MRQSRASDAPRVILELPMIVPRGLATLAILSCFAWPAHAQWPPAGVSLCGGICGALQPIICPDGAGGAYVSWRDGYDDVYIQRVTASGSIAPGWPAVGTPLCIAPNLQAPESIVLDGQGGAIVAWADFRNTGGGGTSMDIYAQRIT